MTDKEIKQVLQVYAVRAKAERYIASVYRLHASQMSALAFVASYMFVRGKEHAGMTAIVRWSGARFYWQLRIRKKIEECILVGALERFPSVNGKGFSIRITEKGKRIVAAYCVRHGLIGKSLVTEARTGKPTNWRQHREIRQAA